MSTGLQSLFPTRILAAPLQRQADAVFNRQLLRECLQLREDDAAGRSWSKTNYLGGFTSYGSVSRMHQMSPTFARLAKRIDRHVARFAKALQFDLRDRHLEMTDCWVNIMPQGVVHSLHLHPLSTFSGTYYVQTPRGVPGLKFEDPRLDRYMAAPPRLPDADLNNRPWVLMPATAGSLLLFESWLRHEVMPNPVARERISISFNYSWF